MIALIVAMDRNRVIGYHNDMPWHLPNDLAHFKKTTTGHTILMGRRTFDSIGRPLPNRKNVVLTRSKDLQLPDGVQVIHDLQFVLDWKTNYPNEKLFIIGGAHLYEQTLPYVDRMYITKIDAAFPGDTYFPAFSEKDWMLLCQRNGKLDENNRYPHQFFIYERHQTSS